MNTTGTTSNTPNKGKECHDWKGRAFQAKNMNGRVIRGTGAVFGHKGPPPGTCTPYPYARAFPDTPHRRARPVYAHMGGLSFASGPLMVGWVMYGHVRVVVAFIPAEAQSDVRTKRSEAAYR